MIRWSQLRNCRSRLSVHVGGVRQQSQHALVAQFTQPGQVNHAVLCGGVDFEVAGEYHRTHRGMDGEGHGIGDGVVDVDELHGEAAGLYHVAGLMGNQLDLVGQPVLFQFQLDQSGGHGGAMDGAIDLPHQIGDGTDVVLVSVGDEQAPQFLLICRQVGKVGDHQIHAVHILFGETDAAVHHDHVLAVFQDGDVLSDLIQTAQRDNFQFFSQIKYSFQIIQAQQTGSRSSGIRP